MLYTIGYARLTPQTLAVLAERLEAIVTDCRAKPASKKPGFNRPVLMHLLGPRYEWWGDRLGGWPPGAEKHSTTTAGISELRSLLENENRLLICVEEHPEDCHRHSLICGPHFPESLHIFRGSLFTAAALNKAMASNHPELGPELCGELGDLIGVV